MERIKILMFFFLTCFYLNSCCIPLIQKKYYTTQYGSDRPKKNKFKLAKIQPKIILNKLFSKDVIYTKIDSVYIKSVKTKKEELHIYNSFLRFFETGQYISGTTDDFTFGINDYNNLDSGVIGYYYINRNKLITEQFLVTSHDCGKYHKGTLKIIGDSIIGYNRIKIKNLKGIPNW
ncbi:MAG: hypothetical protein KGV44_06060 [Flavobacteriaceae bacterium]|nr:hypothetical protein [Flavobacteriaceae bacterium]